MPCNAVATASVSVDLENFEDVLFSEEIVEAVKRYLGMKYKGVVSGEVYGVGRGFRVLDCMVGDLRFTLYESGEITVRDLGASLFDSGKAEAAAADLRLFVSKIKGRAIQAQVRKAVRRVAAVESESTKGGNLVLNINL